MAEPSRSGWLHDFHMASRKAEEAALRRYQAVHWLQCFVGPLGISNQPSEKEFISCLRNGLILCNVINKIQPGSVPKVVDNHLPVQSEQVIWDSQPLPAYQYFENVRNVLMAVRELKLPAFDASDLERENVEAGSAARITDCILALKSYHEWKEWSGGNGVYKHVTAKSPLILHSAAKSFPRPLAMEGSQRCRRLDLSAVDDKQSLTDSIVKALTEHMVESKENISNNFLPSFQNGNQDPVQIFNELLSWSLEEKLRNKFPTTCKARSRKRSSYYWRVLQSQEKDLSDIKVLWSQTKIEFEDLQSQLFNDLTHLGSLVEEMSTPALRYQKVEQENRKLYNMVQDLKGNIRVHCRIRPILNAEATSMIDFDGEDGSLVVVDPSKPNNGRRKVFQFNRVYGPMATQVELFKDAQPLIRSVMDGHNVCILAFGRTGSGKTYTMYGPSGASEKEMGINFLALNDLFQMANKRRDVIDYEVYVQVVEICNEEIRDLLAEDSASHDESDLPNVTLQCVKSIIDAVNLVKRGGMNRLESSTAMINNGSTHSHSVVTVHVHGKDISGNILRGRLQLVDLAGSGEVDNSEESRDDKSLSCLKDVITSLSQKSSYIPYRNSKLTSLLQHGLGGHAKILMFAHVSPEGDNITETVSTLKFAQKVSTVELGAAQSNKMNSEVMELKQEIENLKSALMEKETRSQPNRQLRSPCEKARVIGVRSPLRSRRLSMENPGSMNTLKLPKSPIERQKITKEPTPQKSMKSKPKEPRSPCDESTLERSIPRHRRLSIENPMINRSEKAQKLKEPRSPCDGKKGLVKGTPPRLRSLSIESPGSNENKSATSGYLSQPAFTDCAVKFPTVQPPTTPEQKKLHRPEMGTTLHYGVNISMDSQTPSIGKSTNGKSSQIRTSLRTIGKLINGSEKKNQQKMESSSMKGKDAAANEAKSPPSKARVLRRQSLTGIPPPGSDRRSSLGGMSAYACPNDNRNAKTPPSVRSSTKMTKRWM